MSSRIAFVRVPFAFAFAGLVSIGCVEPDAGDDSIVVAEHHAGGGGGPAVGLAVEVDNGSGVALQLKQGQTFYLNQIDLRASKDVGVDEGVSGLDAAGDFAHLHWHGVALEESEPVLLANGDGTFTRRRFYRGAEWMKVASDFVLEQIDAHGHVLDRPVFVTTGVDNRRDDDDSFFDRRFRAIQWTNDCKTMFDCTGATSYREEALVELRYALHPEQTFTLDPRTTALRLRWSLHGEPYTIPVTQIEHPQFAYGFSIDVAPVTPPNGDGTYSPGDDITFQMTLRDGEGNRLSPPGDMPSYNDVIFGSNPAGIQYYRAFFDPTATYWRRKHRERNMMVELIGPMQNAQPIRTIAPLDEFLGPDDVQTTGTVAADGVYAQFHLFPTSHDVFGGAFDPTHAGWANPVPDTWTDHIPDDAPAGTYSITAKGRRTFMGEDVPFTRTIEIQVGTTQHTQATLNTGGCNNCHNGQSSLADVLHANADRTSCAGCHVPLGFELEGPIYVRTHFVHSRSHRLGAPLDKCASCHLSNASIQRTSKSACLSCHRSYPASHVQAYGPITNIYVGSDGPDAFQQCTTTCHRSHPNSQL